MRVALELDDLRIMLRRERQRATRIAAQVERIADLDDVPTGAVAQAHQLHCVADYQLVRDLLQHLQQCMY